jgi:hypothetical protein
MRFRVPELFLGAFLAVAIFAMGLLFASSAFQPYRAEQQDTTAHRADKESNQGHQAKSLWIPEDSTGFFTLWIAAFTGILAVSTIFLWRSTRDAAIAGRRAAEHIPRVERAYLFVGPFHPITQMKLNENYQITKVGLRFENHGKTPAILKSAYGQFSDWMPTDEVPTYNFANGQVCMLDIVVPATGDVMGMEELFESPIVGPQYFSGYAEYDDIFREETRVSRFCLKIFPDTDRVELVGPRSWNDWTQQ